MQYVRLSMLASAALLALGISSPVRAQIAETEPNSSCASAQSLGALSDTFTVTGSLDSPPSTPDVDFYRITGTPGDVVRIDMQGQASGGGTLPDPFLGAFASDCTLRGYIDNDGVVHPDSGMEQIFPADGTMVIAASSSYDGTFTGQGGSAGSYILTVRRVPLARGIGGRLVNRRTGEPVEGAWVWLNHCREEGWCFDPVGSAFTGPDGLFRFEPGRYTLYQSILRAGEYTVSAYAGARFQQLELPPFPLAEGQDLDLGDVGMAQVPVIGSVRGRLVDAQTGAPLSAGLWSTADLLRCEGDSCFAVAHWQRVDDQGRFVFESSDARQILPGRYRIRARGEQYYETDGPFFEIAEDQHLDVGDLPVRSFPVRLTLAQGCEPVPAGGGECRLQIRVTNGGTSRLQAQVWALLRANPIGFPGELTQFQLGNARAVSLAPAASVEVPVSFQVPGSLEDGTVMCVRAYAADRPNPFKTIGLHDVACFRKGALGLTALPEDRKREHLRKTD